MLYWNNHSIENIKIWKNGVEFEEEWREIENFPNYQVSNLGRVKSMSRLRVRATTKTRILKQAILLNGYHRVQISNSVDIYPKLVHVLVAIAFIDNPENKPDVNHTKGIKSDNRESELEWVTKSENTIHAIKTGLFKIKSGADNGMFGKLGAKHHRSKPILQFNDKGVLVAKFEGLLDAARITGLKAQNISHVCNGKRNSCGGYIFLYEHQDVNLVYEKVVAIKKTEVLRIRDIKTGVIYDSIRECSRVTTLHRQTIQKSIRSENPYSFEYIKN
jgi:hypothetical protein